MNRRSWLPWLALLISLCSALFLALSGTGQGSRAQKLQPDATKSPVSGGTQQSTSGTGLDSSDLRTDKEVVSAIKGLTNGIWAVTAAFLALSAFQFALASLVLRRGAPKGDGIAQSGTADAVADTERKKYREEIDRGRAELDNERREFASERADFQRALKVREDTIEKLHREREDLRGQLTTAATARRAASRETKDRLVVAFDPRTASVSASSPGPLKGYPDGYFELEATEHSSFFALRPAIGSLTTEQERLFMPAFDFLGGGRRSFRLLQPAVVQKTNEGYELLRKGLLLPV